ncbi:MAG: zinc ribbon domain-containing protein [Nitrospirae bacterium]|nr:MAG: zinc ribbon domain-containing protein [Nitrospirota bacterium]
MPIYEYICNACSEKFSQLRSMSESEKAAECPRCSSINTKKVMSSFCCSGGDSGFASSGHSHGGGGG